MNKLQTRFLITPMLSVHNDELYLYGKREWITEPPPRKQSSLINLQLNYNHNKLSNNAKRKSKRAIKYLLFNANEKKVYNPKFKSSFSFKVGFITLTLPSEQIHTDQEIKSICLNQFLIEAKKKWCLINYIWKAERQQNGNIHFHILSDKFIPHQELRNVWNRIINKLGYVDKYKEKHHKKNPNSTDIHSLYKIKNIYSYISKYMTKQVSGSRIKTSAKEIGYIKRGCKDINSVSFGAKKYLGSLCNNGKIWSCSTSLSNLEGGKTELSDNYIKEIERLQKSKRAKRIDKDYVSCIYFDNSYLNATNTPLLFELFKNFVQSKFSNQLQNITYPNSAP